jgi:hypothetical protein
MVVVVVAVEAVEMLLLEASSYASRIGWPGWEQRVAGFKLVQASSRSPHRGRWICVQFSPCHS